MNHIPDKRPRIGLLPAEAVLFGTLCLLVILVGISSLQTPLARNLSRSVRSIPARFQVTTPSDAVVAPTNHSLSEATHPPT